MAFNGDSQSNGQSTVNGEQSEQLTNYMACMETPYNINTNLVFGNNT